MELRQPNNITLRDDLDKIKLTYKHLIKTMTDAEIVAAASRNKNEFNLHKVDWVRSNTAGSSNETSCPLNIPLKSDEREESIQKAISLLKALTVLNQ